MGLFGNKNQVTRAGTYKSEWPNESGLGTKPYSVEQDDQERYLIYTSERRKNEPVAAEDMKVMDAAMSLLYRMAGGTPVNEVPLIQGQVDVQWVRPSPTTPHVAEALLTDRRFIMWWSAGEGRRATLVVLDHLVMRPMSERSSRLPFEWENALVTDYPVQVPADIRAYANPSVFVSVHFGADGHANRRSRSVVASLEELETRRSAGKTL
jgi:hypothetical protein